MRLPLVEGTETRDGTQSKDTLVYNAYIEKSGKRVYLKKRFGTSLAKQSVAGVGQCMFILLGLEYYIIGDKLYSSASPLSAIYDFSVNAPAGYNLSVTGLPYQVTISADGNTAFIKTEYYAWALTSTVIETITAGLNSGSTSVSYTVNPSGVSIGNTVTGSGIPSGTTVTGVSLGTGFTISNPAYTTNTAVTLTIGAAYAVVPMPIDGGVTGIIITNAGSGGTPALTYNINASAATSVTNFVPVAIAYGNGYYVAVGTTGSLTATATYLTSVDGVTWVVNSLPASIIAGGVAFGGGKFCITSYGSTHCYTTTTTNAAPLTGSWTLQTMPGASLNWGQIAYGSNIFLAVNGTQAYATSADGVTWVSRVISGPASAPFYYGFVITATPNAVNYCNGKFFISSSTVTTNTTIMNPDDNYVGRWWYVYCQFATSTDGVSWTTQAVTATDTGNFEGAPLFYSAFSGYSFNQLSGSSFNGSTYLAYANTPGSIPCLAISNDGINWTSSTQLTSGCVYVISNNGTIFIAMPTTSGTGHNAAYSFDGKTWTNFLVNPVGNWLAIGNNGSLFTILSDDATVKYTNTTIPTVTQYAYNLSFIGGSGSGATGRYTIGLNGTITGAIIDNNGTGYTASPPTVQFPQGNITNPTPTQINGVNSVPASNPAAIVTVSAYPPRTVPGVAYLDSTYYVMDINGVITGSNLEAPLAFSSLNTIIANSVSGTPKALARYLNYVVALKSQSTEFFFDNANPAPASPLGAVPSALSRIGCASGYTVVSFDNSLIWVSQSQEFGMQVQMMSGLQAKVISSPDEERILNDLTVGTVFSAYAIKIDGHNFYVLNCGTSATLVYDITSGQWGNWTWLTVNQVSTGVTLSYSAGLVTGVTSGAVFPDGDIISITGAATNFNGQYVAYNPTGSTTFTYYIASGDPQPTGTSFGTVTDYNEQQFPMICYLNDPNVGDLLLHGTNGAIYSPSTGVWQDNGLPIDVSIRTDKLDGGNTDSKFFSRIEVVSDKQTATASIRYSDNDYTTWSYYRPVDLSITHSKITRCGSAVRRAFQLKYVDNSPIRFEAIDCDTE